MFLHDASCLGDGGLPGDDEDDEDSTPRRIETLRDILGLPRPPIKLLRYRGMGLKSVKWLFAELKSRYQLEFDYDWAAHVPDVRPLEVLEPLLAELEQKTGRSLTDE